MSATPTTKTNTAEAAAKAALAAKRKAQAEAEAEQAKLDELRRDVPPGIGEIEELEKAARTIRAKLLAIQTKLRVTKDRGKGHNPNAQVTYEYRNAEDILEAVKPLCAEVGAVVTVDVAPKVIGESVPVEIKVVGKDKYKNDILAMLSGPRFVAVATATLSDCATGESVSASSFAMVDAWRKGQTEPEKLCGSADSYASKYALGHLFALDNNRDADMESDGANNGASAPTPQDAGPLPDGCDF